MASGTEVLVALSGGIDSAAAVDLLREAGYRPRALFLDMLDSAPARERARRVAGLVQVPLTVEPCAELFRREVVDHTLAEHAAGRTPSPCSRCNPRIKWHLLAEAADRMGIFHIATGHYVRTAVHDGHTYFRRGADATKDQSYYLWDVPEEIAARALLPLGEHTKRAVRERMAERYGFPAARESMGVCFTGDLSYETFLRHHLPAGCLMPGEAVDWETGAVIGRHEGYARYTAGQKRGITLSGESCGTGKTVRVVSLDPLRNRVVVSSDERALLCRTLRLRAWRAPQPEELLTRAEELEIRIRGIGRNPRPGCRATIEPDGRLCLTLLHDSAWAAMPGQPVVCYLDDRVAGGGLLDEATG